MTFHDLNLSPEVLRAIDEVGFDTPTEIQEKAIPFLLEGRDVTGKSHTGTGKTAAFSIPAIENVTEENKRVISTLILCPTRELAQQATDEIKKYSKYKPIVKVAAIFGGQSYDRQISALRNGANIIVGTPGRVMDHMKRRTLKLDNLSIIVLDEADEMLNMGFKEDIEKVLKDVPEERQTVLFSATIPPAIMAITKKYQKNPELVAVAGSNNQSALITQYYCDVARGQKLDTLHLLLKYVSPRLAIVFCNTKRMVDELEISLNSLGFNAAGLHGDMKQSARTAVMDKFKSGKTSILIATDVAARGIDVNGIDAVFNFDIPQDCEYYVHRIGRTGRAGKEGASYTIISGGGQYKDLNRIKQVTKSKMEKINVPSPEEISAKENVKIIESVVAKLSEETVLNKDCETIFEQLIEKGFSEKQIALSLLDQVLPKAHKRLPKVNNVMHSGNGTRDNNRGGERGGERGGASRSYDNTGFAQVSLSIGRKDGVAPNHIVGAVADKMNMPGSDIGKITILQEYTLVDVPKDMANKIAQEMNHSRIKNIGITAHVATGSSTQKPRSGGDRGRFGGNKSGGSGSRKGFTPRKRTE